MMHRISAMVLATCILLSGCAASPVDTYTSQTADALQSGVIAVTDASASGDPASALARLDELQATLLDAYAKGTVVKSRFDSISAAIDLVRADLERAISAQADVVTNTNKVDTNPGKPGKSDKPDKND